MLEAILDQTMENLFHYINQIPSNNNLLMVKNWILEKKTIPVAGRGGLQGCETLRIPHCLDNRLKDGGKVVSSTHWLSSIPQKHYFSASGLISARDCVNLRA
jgi:hypothetical protein